MTAPPENLANRALIHATRSCRLLGIMSSIYGLFAILAYGYLNRFARFRIYFAGLALLIWFAPGVLFLLCGFYLRHRNRIGAILGIVIALFQSLCAAAMLTAFCTLPPISPVPIIMCLAWLAALGQLMLHLQRSLRAIEVDAEVFRGFDLAAPKTALRVEPVTRIDESGQTQDAA
jgi:hypothetical protein